MEKPMSTIHGEILDEFFKELKKKNIENALNTALCLLFTADPRHIEHRCPRSMICT